MLKLLFIVAWRNICRDKLTSFIQLSGLIIGIGCFILIQLYVDHQRSYNEFFTDAKDIYRIDLIRDEAKPQAATPLRLANELTQNFKEVQDATRVSTGTVSVKQEQSMYSEFSFFADENYFEFFDFELLEGDKLTALNAPDSLVLHADLALKYFNRTTGVLGERLTINGQEHQVTGVIKKTMAPTTMPVQMLVPTERFYELLPSPEWVVRWNFNSTVTYVKLIEEPKVDLLTANVSAYYQERAKGTSSYKNYRVNIEPLLDVYLYTESTYTLGATGSAVMVNVFGIISLMILILACVNFTNLSTASAMRRGKDVGVRKALGASKRQLVTQYIAESLLQSIVATFLAVLLVMLFLPSFNQLMNVDIEFVLSTQKWIQLSHLTLFVGVIAGSYPAFYLSNLSPALVLKGIINTSKSSTLIRQSLIVLQFSIATFLLVASLVVNWQMQYIKNMPQGYDREGVIVLGRGGDLIYNSFKNQLLRHPDVVSATMSHTVPTKPTRTSNIVRRQDDISNEIWVGNNPISYDFFQTYGIQLTAGRDFAKTYTNDVYRENEQDWQSSTGKIIINETLAANLGWNAEQAVGQMITLGGGNDGLHSHQIVGVVEDSHYINVKNSVPPMTYVLSGEPTDLSLRWTSIRLKASASAQTLKEIEQIWLSLSGDVAFKYDWVSSLFDASYRDESQQTELLNVFTVLAVLVTSIGLFGLAAFNTQRRVKEIAIRKILGAKTTQICFMLVNQFSWLVLLANVIALPIAYFLMRDWLNDFIYRINMPYSAFVLSALLSITIAYITVVVIAYRAATSQPIDSLQCE